MSILLGWLESKKGNACAVDELLDEELVTDELDELEELDTVEEEEEEDVAAADELSAVEEVDDVLAVDLVLADEAALWVDDEDDPTESELEELEEELVVMSLVELPAPT
jgi:hypothetical protein